MRMLTVCAKFMCSCPHIMHGKLQCSYLMCALLVQLFLRSNWFEQNSLFGFVVCFWHRVCNRVREDLSFQRGEGPVSCFSGVVHNRVRQLYLSVRMVRFLTSVEWCTTV